MSEILKTDSRFYGVAQDVVIDRIANQIRPLHKAGKTINEIVKETGLPRHRVERVMRERGMSPHREKKKEPGREWYREAMLRHRKGMRPAQIAEELLAMGHDVKVGTLRSYFGRVRDGLAPDPLED